jgi:dCMP deaminase
MSEYKRPTWDEYFMEVARTIAKRATCDRGRSGCVVARDKQILDNGLCRFLLWVSRTVTR